MSKPEVHCGNTTHPHLYKTLNLLDLDLAGGKTLYIVVEGVANKDDAPGEHARYFYEEHTCPTNFLRVPAVSVNGDIDPHGLFNFVRAVWMPQKYVDLRMDSFGEDTLLLEFFPELGQSGRNPKAAFPLEDAQLLKEMFKESDDYGVLWSYDDEAGLLSKALEAGLITSEGPPGEGRSRLTYEGQTLIRSLN